ncbi:hypothetical protein LH51_12875 [Nitrincola sp. A-D6]|uniref:hypothetical protein n=1 Tax=Nitrincola sp. A-D6 TaxID=1545442 RepID=UPI00051FAE12|nr:hypothetical protein [Nitrincola sp. A-D6]KGK41689.1 hypothetical protein LH51_12875 [Nitrincola sp. A-D6]
MLNQTVQQLAAERQAADVGEKVDRVALPPERPGGSVKQIKTVTSVLNWLLGLCVSLYAKSSGY